MSEPRPDVPPEVEEYFVAQLSAGGELGGRIGGGGAGARGGARGGARAARWIPTQVEERTGVVPGRGDRLRERVIAAHPKLETLRGGEPWRFAVPVGLMDLGRILVDLHVAPTPDGSAAEVRLVAYGKERVLFRRTSTTARVADAVWAALEVE